MTDTQRVRQAREKLADAVREERLALIAAAPALRGRARRRRAAVRLALVAALVVAVAAAGVGLWATLSASSTRSAVASSDDAVAAASAAVVTMLTPDPANADAYLAAIVDDSTGDQRRRFEQNHGAIAEYVRSSAVRPAGSVVTAGSERADGDTVDVVLVAQATDPTLVGGQQGEQRVTLRVTMTRSDDRWLVANTERLS
ncbi:hypothetical protein nbrc107696_03110 [Gordonia spumicola]|uniref:Mce-associated membrane protein n=1 Tax=Gordonia spumicola TaxID=589161 RepID=A0A7I9V380_9ACTN|nr:hypothetical protein [Gordonia spumicola]GED99864.1 hypothetical protein nbrc107696_03110 [Gordonia spumicola]